MNPVQNNENQNTSAVEASMLVFITTKGFDHLTLSKVPLGEINNNKIYPINPYISHILIRFTELL